jgi:hypothetical protein
MIEAHFNHAQQLGYHFNPFSLLDPQEWRAAAILPPAVEAALQDGWTHMQIMGEKGHGKTTTLLKLADTLTERGKRTHYEYIPPAQRHFITNLADPLIDVALIDEVQRLWPWEKRRLIAGVGARAQSLHMILGTHVDFNYRFRCASLALTTVILDVPEPAVLQHMLNQRLAYAALNPQQPAPVMFTSPACEALLHLFGGDLRSMEAFLYEVFAQLDTPGAITAEMIERVPRSAKSFAHAGRRSIGNVKFGFWKTPRLHSTTSSQVIEM